MKTVTAEFDLFQAAHNWASANPAEFCVGMVVALAAFCYWNALKDCLK